MATPRLRIVPPPCETVDAPLTAKVQVTGRTLADLLDGLDLARAAIADEILLGGAPDGSFQFFVEGVEL